MIERLRSFTARKYATIGVAAILLVAIPITLSVVKKQQENRSSAAASEVTLDFNPPSGTAQINNTIPISLYLNSNGQDITAVDFTFAYDKNIFTIQSVDASTSAFDDVFGLNPDNALGSYRFVGTVKGSKPVNSSEIKVITLNISGVSEGTGSISFSTDPQVAILGENQPAPYQIIGGTYTFTVGPASTNSASPTLSPNPSSTLSPTIHLSPTGDPLITPSPYPYPLLTITPTLAPDDTAVNFSIKVPAIGNQQFENNAPIFSQRRAEIELFNSQNEQVFPKDSLDLTFPAVAFLEYSTQSGQFQGYVPLGSHFGTDQYTVKLKLHNSLRKLLPGIVSITQGSILNAAPSATVVTGDLDGDNEMTVLDYNIMIGCTNNQSGCDSYTKILADLNDDGLTDSIDLNLLYEAFGIRIGD